MIDPREVETHAINLGGAGVFTKAAVAGQRWSLIYMVLSASAVASSFVIGSGGTPVTGIVPLPANLPQELGDGTTEILGAIADNQTLTLTAGAADVDGWLQVVMLR